MAKFEICIGNIIGFEYYSDSRKFKSTIESQFGKSYDIDGVEFEYKYFESDNEDFQMFWKASGASSRVKVAARKLFSMIKPVWEKEEAKYEHWEENDIFLDIYRVDDLDESSMSIYAAKNLLESEGMKLFRR